MSGIINNDELSKHLGSRKNVELELKKGTYNCTTLRAGIIIGSGSASFEIIRDTELEQFTEDVLSVLLKSNDLNVDDLNIYFVKSDQINAFVTGGKNIFINTETIIKAENYGEYAAVLAHELAHIIGGHIFSTNIEISNLSDKALPIYLLGIIGMITGSADTGLVGVMVGQASVNDNFLIIRELKKLLQIKPL